MATQLETVNRVLRRLREDTVGTIIENDYAILIAEFVNAGMEDVIAAHDWQRYVGLLYAEIVVGGAGGTLSNVSELDATGGNVLAGTPLNEQSKITWLGHDSPNILYSDTAYATATTTEADWYKVNVLAHADYLQLVTLDNTSSKSTEVAPVAASLSDRHAADGTLVRELNVWPYTTTAGCLAISAWTPPAVLALDGTDDDTVIPAPVRPIFEFALLMALNERGEEIGEPGNLAERRYVDALQKAIEDDMDWYKRTDKSDWRRD